MLTRQQEQAFTNSPFTRPQDRTLSPESMASYMRATKTFFSVLECEELIASNPVEKVKLARTPRKAMPVLSEQEL